jgi:hypothetical protein
MGLERLNGGIVTTLVITCAAALLLFFFSQGASKSFEESARIANQFSNSGQSFTEMILGSLQLGSNASTIPKVFGNASNEIGVVVLNPMNAAKNDVIVPKRAKHVVNVSVNKNGATTVGVAALLKNENHALLEWLEHYLAEVGRMSSLSVDS